MDPDGMVLVAALLSDTNTAVHMRYIQYTVMWRLKGVDRDPTETVFIDWMNWEPPTLLL